MSEPAIDAALTPGEALLPCQVAIGLLSVAVAYWKVKGYA